MYGSKPGSPSVDKPLLNKIHSSFPSHVFLPPSLDSAFHLFFLYFSQYMKYQSCSR